jgi:hypothetical protein
MVDCCCCCSIDLTALAAEKKTVKDLRDLWSQGVYVLVLMKIEMCL